MAASGKGTIDLLNVDYEDVLHLYRGWRHAEGQLKDKNKELNALRNRVKQLQDSHVKFRGQIQALESVKELTITLRTQLAALEEENKKLAIENSTLSEVNNQAEELLIEGENSAKKLSSQMNKMSVDFAELKGRYEHVTTSHSQLEELVSEEQSARLSAESRVKTMEQIIDKLTAENREYKWKLDTAQSKINQCDKEIALAASQLSGLSEEVADMAHMREKLSFVESEKDVLKGDIVRLLRLLEHYPAGKGFLKQWQDSEGMSFVGSPKHSAGRDREQSSLFDQEETDPAGGPDSITPQELNHLKRVHEVDHDTHIMFPTMEEELDHWAPQDSVIRGFEFLTSNIPNAPVGVLQTFIRRMNKIWLRRERRKAQRIKEKYESRIADLKRQLSNAKPYHGVMAERKIRTLNSQMKSIRGKYLTGRPKAWHPDDSDDDDLYLYENESVDDLRASTRSSRSEGRDGRGSVNSTGRSNSQPPPRRCSKGHPIGMEKVASVSPEGHGHHVHQGRSASTLNKFDKISAKEFLGASLSSLEALGRRSQSQHLYSSFDPDGHQASNSFQDYLGEPSAEYLRGAVWLGRNMLMVTEEMVEQMDLFRSRYLREVSSVSREEESGSSRNLHRLSLLAASGITEAMSTVYHCRTLSRKMLQDASAISPGDKDAMDAYLKHLPIESMLSKAITDQTGGRHISFATDDDKHRHGDS